MLSVMIPWSSDLLQHAVHHIHSATYTSLLDIVSKPKPPVEDPSTIPDPGLGTPPPQVVVDKIVMIVGWVVWFGVGSGVVAIIVIGIRMTINHHRGQSGSHIASMVIVGFGIVTIISGRAIVVWILIN